MHDLVDAAERWTRRTGLAAVLAILALLLWSVWRGTRRPAGYKTGHEPKWLRTSPFYFLASMGYFGFCYRLWQPLPMRLSQLVRALALVLGSLLYFSGLTLVLWGRLALAQMYNVSSSLGVQLYADHQLITHGPFALVRHPMYLGVLLTSVGGILLYRTWTFLFVLLHFPALLIRARREEWALAAEFDEQWAEYCHRVPAWLPRLTSAVDQGA